MVVKNTNKNNNITTITELGNCKYKYIDSFECFNNSVFNFQHYSGLLINNIIFDNYLQFSNTNQYISYVEHYPVIPPNNSYIFLCLILYFKSKKTININSILWE